MSSPTTLEAIGSAISSLELADGPTRYALPDGPTIERYGLAPVPVSRAIKLREIPKLASYLGSRPPLLTQPADWKSLLQDAVDLAFEQGATPEDIRAEIVRIAPLPGIEVALDPPKADRRPRTLQEFASSSAAQLGIDGSDDK